MKHEERIEQERKQEAARRKRSRRTMTFIFLMAAILFVLVRVVWKTDSKDQGGTVSSETSSVEPAVNPLANQWNLLLVNHENPFPRDLTLNLSKLEGDWYVDARTVSEASKMLADAKAGGVSLQICSAYRNVSGQKKLYDAEGPISSGQPVSVQAPGESEHHTGLALDFLTTGHSTLDEGFEDTKAFEWLSAHAWEYGYVLRYPKDKEDVTGVIYEPWHYRYVGKEHAKIMREKGLCLEEYLQGKGVEGE